MKLKMTKSNVLKRAKRILDDEGVTFEILHDIHGGWAYPKDSHVRIGTRGYMGNQLASVVCHELAHILNFRNRKFLRYHDFGLTTIYTEDLAKMRIQIGLKAELYTDQVAKKLMKVYYPELKFVRNYGSKKQSKWYREVFLKDAKEFLGRVG